MQIYNSLEAIECICLYYPDEGYTLSTNQTVSSLELYHAADFLLSLEMDESAYPKAITRTVQYLGENRPKTVVSVVRPLPIRRGGRIIAYVIIDISYPALARSLKDITTKNASTLVIYDEDGNIINATGKNYYMEALLQDSVVSIGSVGNRYTTIGDDDLFVYYTKTDGLNWIYVYAVDANTFNKKIIQMRNTTVNICLLVMLFGLTYSWFAAKKLFKPIRNISNKISEEIGDTHRDVFERIDIMISRSEQMKKRLMDAENREQKLNQIKRALMQIKNDKLKQEEIVLQEGEKAFVLIGVIVDTDCENLELDQLVLLFEPHKVRPFIKLYTAPNEITFIAAVRTNSLEDLRACGELLFAENKDLELISVGISMPFYDYGEVTSAYHQMKEAMGMCIVRGKGTVCCYEDICDTIKNKPEYPYKLEYAVLNAFKNMNEEELRDSIYAFERYLVEADAIAHTVKDFYTRLFCSLQRELPEISLEASAYMDYSHLDLINRYSIKEMSNYIIDMCKHLLNTRTQKPEKSVLVEQVCDYIKEHISEAPTIEAIADEFNISVSTLRNEFSRVMNMSIKNYIDLLRIETSKELLTSTNKKVQEIASLMGFNYSQSFIAFFKSATGMTPGEFRTRQHMQKIKLHQKSSSEKEHSEKEDAAIGKLVDQLF